MAITLLYQLGEGAAEETLKPGSGTLGQLATGAQPQQHLLYPQPFASGFTAFGSFFYVLSALLLNLFHVNYLHLLLLRTSIFCIWIFCI